MRVFVAGSTGFIGHALVESLARGGHDVVCGARRPDAAAPCMGSVSVDFTRDFEPAVWLPRLAGSEIVVNAVGLIRERDGQTFDAVHRRAPCAMFEAAARSGVRRIVQLSALGADAAAQSRFHLSKRAADEFLATLPLEWAIVQPSLVFGPGGDSARLFALLASLPFVPVGRGNYRVQPIHLDDLVESLGRLVVSREPQHRRIALVGPRALTLPDYLATLRAGLGLGPARLIPMPERALTAGARLAGFLPGSLVDPESLEMLRRGNTADAAATRALLGREPRDPSRFIAPREREAARISARLGWSLPPLRLAIALVWIVSGIVSLGPYPTAESLALLGRVGVTGGIAPVLLVGAALLDVALGLGTLLLARRRWLWIAQLAVIAGYTVIITAQLPELWAHPFGPVLKNLPMLASIGLLLALERR